MNQNKADLIKMRLQAHFEPHRLSVVDESDQHMGHPGYDGGGKHFAIEICSETLQNITRIEAHRQIYALLNDMMSDAIHALRIKIC